MNFHIDNDGTATRLDRECDKNDASSTSETSDTEHQPEPALPALVVAAHAEWFQIDGGPLVQLETRLALRKLLLALAVARNAKGNGAITSNEAFAAGWPGERAHPNAASVRVYTAIHTIRSLGLRAILLRKNGGYTLEANVTIAAEESQFPGSIKAEDEPLAGAI